MSVYNAVGEGPSSPPHEVFVGEAGEPRCASSPPYPGPPLPGEALQEGVWDLRAPTSSLGAPTHSGPLSPPVPTAAPRNVAVHGPTATQLDVTWEPPPLESQNGDIQGYKVGVLGREGGPGDPGPGGAWEAPRCGEGGGPGLHPLPWLLKSNPLKYTQLEQNATHRPAIPGAGGTQMLEARATPQLVPSPKLLQPLPSPPAPKADVRPLEAVIWPTLVTVWRLTERPVSKGPPTRSWKSLFKVTSRF